MKKSKNKTPVILAMTMVGCITLFVTIGIYISTANNNYPEGIPFAKLLLPILTSIMTLGVLVLLLFKYKSLAKGEPINDEMTHKIALKSGTLAFMLTLYSFVFLGVFSKGNSLFGIDFELNTLSGLMIFLMSLFYGLSYLFFKYIKK